MTPEAAYEELIQQAEALLNLDAHAREETRAAERGAATTVGAFLYTRARATRGVCEDAVRDALRRIDERLPAPR